MRGAFKVGAMVLLLSLVPLVAEAGKVEGVGIGAGTGAVIAGPPGAVVGGAIGYVVGGPNIITGRRHCWRDHSGYRHCSRR
jgi:hypothetical protein